MATTPNKGSGAPRRLGPQQQPQRTSSGAQRRQARAKRSNNSRRTGWIVVSIVIVALLAIGLPKLFSSNTASPGTISVTGNNPPLAPASMVDPVTSISTATYNAVGIAGQAVPFVVTKSQPALTSNHLPRLVYIGAEYCPYCAAARWSMVAALSRFGTFTGLKQSASSPADGNIPTFSFIGSTYKSKYLVFSPIEECNRLPACAGPLQAVPSDLAKLYTTYDAGTAGTGTIFSAGGAGIPFLDLANAFVESGDPPYLSSYFGADNGPLVNGGGLGVTGIAQAIHNPYSAVGKGIAADGFVVMANYLSAAICHVDGQQPSSVCATSGVRAAATAIAAAPLVG